MEFNHLVGKPDNPPLGHNVVTRVDLGEINTKDTRIAG